MSEILRLVRIDFDNMENHDPIEEEILGVFIPSGGLSAWGMAAEWIRTQPPIKMYLGYDHEIYPKFRLIKEKSLGAAQ